VNDKILDLDNMIAPDNEVQNMKCARPTNLYYIDGNKYVTCTMICYPSKVTRFVPMGLLPMGISLQDSLQQ
jgi:hypothetical protein